MIIDIHNHLSGKDTPYRLPVEEYLSVMDEEGVAIAVILGKDYGLLGDRQNANLSDKDVADFIKVHPDRLIGFTAVHPDRDEQKNVERIERAVNDFGLRGVKLNPASGFYPNDQRLYPAYAKAAELSIPVVIHSGIKPPSEGSRLKYCHPIHIDDIAVDFPELKIIVAHGAYPWVDDLIMTGLYAQNIYVDISTLNQIEEVLGYEVVLPTLRRLTCSLGASRIVFGSDGIFNLEPLIRAVKNADFLTENDKKKILCSNAEAILGITG
ncbi:MAG: amidohydrolase family protein [Pseudomonadota bacterium]